MADDHGWDARQREALEKVIRIAEAGHFLSEEEVAFVRQLDDVRRVLGTFGRAAKWMAFVLASFAAIITAWEKIKEWTAQ